jgi:hypothetical protein
LKFNGISTSAISGASFFVARRSPTADQENLTTERLDQIERHLQNLESKADGFEKLGLVDGQLVRILFEGFLKTWNPQILGVLLRYESLINLQCWRCPSRQTHFSPSSPQTWEV